MYFTCIKSFNVHNQWWRYLCYSCFIDGSTNAQHRALNNCPRSHKLGICVSGTWMQMVKFQSFLPYPYTSLDVWVKLRVAGWILKERHVCETETEAERDRRRHGDTETQRPGPQYLRRNTEEGIESCECFGILCRKFYWHLFVITSYLCLRGTLTKTYLALPIFPTETVFLLVSFPCETGKVCSMQV